MFFRPAALQLAFPLSPRYERDYPTGSVGARCRCLYMRLKERWTVSQPNSGCQRIGAIVAAGACLGSTAPLPSERGAGGLRLFALSPSATPHPRRSEAEAFRNSRRRGLTTTGGCQFRLSFFRRQAGPVAPVKCAQDHRRTYGFPKNEWHVTVHFRMQRESDTNLLLRICYWMKG